MAHFAPVWLIPAASVRICEYQSKLLYLSRGREVRKLAPEVDMRYLMDRLGLDRVADFCGSFLPGYVELEQRMERVEHCRNDFCSLKSGFLIRLEIP